MNFAVLSQGIPGADARISDELTERHWAYMDRFADRFVARGPTLQSDRETWTGSLHVIDLPDVAAARAFVADEPYQQAGMYAAHRMWVFENLLGRTMWEFRPVAGEPVFLILAAATPPVRPEHVAVHGSLTVAETGEEDGFLLAIQAPSRAVIAINHTVEVHDWEFGGRR